MSKTFDIEVEYTVVESIQVEADNIDQAEKKALELLKLGATDHTIVGDYIEEAEVLSSRELLDD